MISRHVLGLSLLAAIAAPAPALAANACLAPSSLLDTPDDPLGEGHEELPTTLEADQGEYRPDLRIYSARGTVVLERGRQTLRADEVQFSADGERADASGNVLYGDPALEVSGSGGHIYLNERRGALEDVRFRLPPGPAHGQAEEVRLLNRDEAEFDLVRFTACPPDQEDWWLTAEDLSIDRKEGFGTARNARLSFMGVPFLYTPYISFPIDDRRKTGLLPPRVGMSSEGGFDLALPYYLNLAPNYDATITPRLITRRGLLLDLEGRWLTEAFSTQANVEYLHRDKRTDDRRWLGHLELNSHLASPFYFNVDLNRVSDPEYVDDLGFIRGVIAYNDYTLSSVGQIGYQGENWNLRALAQSFQSLDVDLPDVALPYRTMPRVLFDYRSGLSSLNLHHSVDLDFTRFTHRADDLLDTGRRLDGFYGLSWRHERLAWYFIPTLGYRFTTYELDRPDPALPESPSRGLPLVNLDMGLFLERDVSLLGRRLQQTLEPRLFYLYVPYRNQDDLPLFDTQRLDLSLSRLFEFNRFTGADRIGDANYAAVSIASRFLDTGSGREYLRVAVGQAYYFSDRRVNLSAAEPDQTARTSPVLAELQAHAGRWSATLEHAFGPNHEEFGRRTVRLSYRESDTKAVNVAYRRRTSELGEPLELTELSAVWPIADRWVGFGGWQYSLRSNENLERFVGLAYNTCCWSLRTVAREHLRSNGEPSRSIMLQLELAGLGSVGQPLDKFLSETVSGYGFER